MLGQFLVELDPELEPELDPEPVDEFEEPEPDDGVVVDEFDVEEPEPELVPVLPELPVVVDVVAALAKEGGLLVAGYAGNGYLHIKHAAMGKAVYAAAICYIRQHK